MIMPPLALVRGCNNPVGLNPLSDWIEEQSGTAPDFFGSGFSDGSHFGCHGDGSDYGNGRGGNFALGFFYNRRYGPMIGTNGCGAGYGDVDGGGEESHYGMQ